MTNDANPTPGIGEQLDEVIDFIFMEMHRRTGTPVNSTLRKRLDALINTQVEQRSNQLVQEFAETLKNTMMMAKLRPADELVLSVAAVNNLLTAYTKGADPK